VSGNETNRNNEKHRGPLEANGFRLCVLGAGESGIGAALLAKQKGYDVFVSDGSLIAGNYKQELIDNNIDFEEGGHSEEKILSADEIVKSPGIPEKNEVVKKLRKKGVSVISEIELAFRFKGDSKVVAVTGSNGKSTCVSLIYHICKTAGLDCALVGNIGYSFAKQIAEDPKPLYVAEISSFQLDDIKDFKPDISILLNITEDHLDRYDYKFENYVNSKFKIMQNQEPKDYFIYCKDDEAIVQHLKNIVTKTNTLPFSMKQELSKGAWMKDDHVIFHVREETVEMSIYDFAIKGKHNQYNTMAAGLATVILDIRKEKIREAVATFQSLEHRMEYVATVRGVEFINDSKATNVNSTWYALESMEKPVILILGGIDKGNDYSLIESLVAEKVKAIICLGIDNEKIHKVFGDIVPQIIDVKSAADAVSNSFYLAEKGDVVLLSPACASFDLFTNYCDRGNQFKAAVREL
jgi:UDP-N-acetylmuramoylalanine--D-glutamate ligase